MAEAVAIASLTWGATRPPGVPTLPRDLRGVLCCTTYSHVMAVQAGT